MTCFCKKGGMCEIEPRRPTLKTKCMLLCDGTIISKALIKTEE